MKNREVSSAEMSLKCSRPKPSPAGPHTVTYGLSLIVGLLHVRVKIHGLGQGTLDLVIEEWGCMVHISIPDRKIAKVEQFEHFKCRRVQTSDHVSFVRLQLTLHPRLVEESVELEVAVGGGEVLDEPLHRDQIINCHHHLT